jgi:hypothetical protein
MVKTVTATPARAPHGTKVVVEAFLTPSTKYPNHSVRTLSQRPLR